MSYRQQLRDLLSPLGVYHWEGPFQLGELAALGQALEACDADLEEIQREMQLMTAQGWGLEAIRNLLRRSPQAATTEQLRMALAALLRIGNQSFTLQAMNDTIRGCGVKAVVEETQLPGQVAVFLPGEAGIPDDFSEVENIILDILPCHLEVLFHFLFIRWQDLEAQFPTWKALEAKGLTWKTLERSVPQTTRGAGIV